MEKEIVPNGTCEHENVIYLDRFEHGPHRLQRRAIDSVQKKGRKRNLEKIKCELCMPARYIGKVVMYHYRILVRKLSHMLSVAVARGTKAVGSC